LQNLAALDEVTRQLTHDKGSLNREPIYVICPVLNTTLSLDRFVNIAEQEHPGVFLIFISSEISASDYKRLVRGGSADWASLQNAPQEILNIISRTSQSEPRSADAKPRPAIVAFVPSSGGVGNATLALETAVRGDLAKARAKFVKALEREPNNPTILNNLQLLNSRYRFVQRSPAQ